MRAPTAEIDRPRIIDAIREIIEAIGENPLREGLLRTPERIAEMYAELFSRLSDDPLDALATGFEESHNCLLYTSPSPRDRQKSRMPSSA